MVEQETDANKRGVLICVSGNCQPLVKLRRDNTIFGREKADVIVDDPEVSATHCQVQNISHVYHLFDMNSSNGTFVNGERVVKVKLKQGDRIEIGKTVFEFQLEDEKKVRHIPTVYNAKPQADNLVDSLIENELGLSPSGFLLIKVKYGDGKKELIELAQKVAFIGRASSFGHFDQDTEISRKHLLIKLNDTGEVFVEDQGSTNGSFINGKLIEGMQMVRPSDEIRVGRCIVHIAVRRNPS